MEIDNPDALLEVREAFERYEIALVGNDVAMRANSLLMIRGPSATASGKTSTATKSFPLSAPLALHSTWSAVDAHVDHHLRPRFRDRIDIVHTRPERPARSAGKCRPGCDCHKAGGSLQLT